MSDGKHTTEAGTAMHSDCSDAYRPATPAEALEVLRARLSDQLSPAEHCELMAAIAALRASGAASAPQPRHLVRRGLRPDGTYPLADEDEGPAAEPSTQPESGAEGVPLDASVRFPGNVDVPRALLAEAYRGLKLHYEMPELRRSIDKILAAAPSPDATEARVKPRDADGAGSGASNASGAVDRRNKE